MMEAFLARVRGLPDEDETGSDASSGASDLPESFDWTTAAPPVSVAADDAGPPPPPPPPPEGWRASFFLCEAPSLPVCADLRAATLCRDQGDDGCALEDPKLLCAAQDDGALRGACLCDWGSRATSDEVTSCPAKSGMFDPAKAGSIPHDERQS
jgi:hypothetical protein